MQISTKGNDNLVRVSGVSSYPGFELTGLYCTVFLQISVKLSPWRDIFQNLNLPLSRSFMIISQCNECRSNYGGKCESSRVKKKLYQNA